LHDLAADEPERAKELAAKWDAWAGRTNVKPYPAPAQGGAKKGKKKGNAAKAAANL
jgi:arylsulfatase